MNTAKWLIIVKSEKKGLIYLFIIIIKGKASKIKKLYQIPFQERHFEKEDKKVHLSQQHSLHDSSFKAMLRVKGREW